MDPIFIEPATGRKFAVERSPYLGIEYLWNHQNFWICMQLPEDHSDSRAVPASLAFDLSDADRWQYVLEEGISQVRPT